MNAITCSETVTRPRQRGTIISSSSMRTISRHCSEVKSVPTAHRHASCSNAIHADSRARRLPDGRGEYSGGIGFRVSLTIHRA